MAEMEMYKDSIPEFVFKLYHILERNEFKEIITWANEGTEILIKNSKKLQDKVLPSFFRHKHISSFIRQLNMYKFNKVNKISKQRSHMYFKNEFFRRGEFEEMKLIKRTQRPKKGEQNQQPSIKADCESDPVMQPSATSELTIFKNEAHTKFGELHQILNRILKKHPGLKEDMIPAIQICEAMRGQAPCLQGMGESSFNNLFPEDNNDHQKNINLLGTTVRDLPILNSMIYPSLCSLANLDA